MKYLFLLSFAIVYFLNGQIAYAENNEGFSMADCIAPNQEEEEFSPSLCPFHLPAVKNIEIQNRRADTKNPDYQARECSKFLKITEKQVLNFFKSANRVSDNDLHAKLPEVSPCRISGKIHFKDGTKADWTLLGSIQLGHISGASFPERINLYCPESCAFIPTYESQNNP